MHFHISNRDTYFDDVALQFMTDIAAYYNIDLDSEEGIDTDFEKFFGWVNEIK